MRGCSSSGEDARGRGQGWWLRRGCLRALGLVVALAACSSEPSGASPDAVAALEDAALLDASSLRDGGTSPGTDGGTAPGTDGGNSVWRPTPGTSWQWQLSGSLDTSYAVAVYDIDLFETAEATIDQLHAAGRKVVCYFSAGSYENWRPDEGSFPTEVLGEVLDGWPDERWLDITSASLRPIMRARLDLAQSKGCDGVEPDNVDAYSNETGFTLTAADQLAYNRFLAAEAHTRGLAVALKNDLEQVAELVDDFDFALNEECFSYDECALLAPFIDADKAVFQVEYGAPSLADSICPQANALDFDTLIKNLDLDAWRVACR